MAQQKPLILYDNVLDKGGTLTAGSTAAGYDVLNLKDLRPYLKWKAANTNIQDILYDAGVGNTVTADCFVIMGHNLGSQGAYIRVMYSSDKITWNDATPLNTSPPSDNVYMAEFASPGAYRYWQARITNLTVAPEMAILMFGLKLQMERFLTGNFDPTTEGIVGASKSNDAGQILGSVVLHNPVNINASWSRLTPSWVDTTFRPVWDSHIKKLKPFFWAWDPGDHSSEVYFVKVPDNFTLNMPYDPVRRSLTLSMQGLSEV